MNYTFFKNAQSKNTLLLMCSNGNSVLRLYISTVVVRAMVLLLFIFIIWLPFAENFNNWIQTEVEYYSTFQKVNKLQQYALNKTKIDLYYLKKKFLSLKKEGNYLQGLLSIAPLDSSAEIKISDLDKEEIRIQKHLLGKRIENNSVLLNGQIILEFYEDIVKENNTPSGEQRAILA
ncbi:MAG: hypothetical protein KKA19_04355, partial [Candidatus Margulisbacteria bacterium]|nr:hypothetical protein [Candidatus Margulisiibacteriota bacterium]